MGNVTFDFSDRVVAVSGAATGIGRATAESFAAAGAATFLLDVDEENGEAAASRILAGGGRARFLRCDVTDPEAVAASFRAIAEEHGRLDVLVNNAGGFWVQRTTEDLPVDEWHRVIDLNLTAVFLVSREAIPLLRGSRAGRIINIGSLAGQTAIYRSSPSYSAAKAGVHALSRVMAYELAGDGITVNAVAPSAVLTERVKQVRGPEEREETARSIPLGRYSEPAELAAWMLFLASDEAGYLTGQTIAVNGGRFMV